MGLDQVLVTEKDLLRLYDPTRDYQYCWGVLRDNGLLPLTMRSLTTEPGKSLVHFATWTYVSGYVNCRFVPGICEEKEVIDEIMPHLGGLAFAEFKYEAERKKLEPKKHAGALGRLVNAMGVPQRTHNLEDCPRELSLPIYMMKLAQASNGRERSTWRELLDITAHIFFSDRLKKHHGDNTQYVLDLRTHYGKDEARAYTCSVISYLNQLRTGSKLHVQFTDDQIRLSFKDDQRVDCDIALRPHQLGALAMGKRPLLEVRLNSS